MSQPLDAIVGDIVAADYRTAGVFEQFGIDFCCGGRRSLGEACRTASADPADVVRALTALSPHHVDDTDVTRWPVARLIDHIVSVHHAYVRAALPRIVGYLAKLQEAHGARHPELARVASVFDQVSVDLVQHMLKEEQVLFPYVRELAEHAEETGDMQPSPFGTVLNPIRMMEREHREAADELGTIRELTNGYTVPEDGCTTYTVSMAELARFEQDLHRHVHLENNVLFPKAIQLETRS
ncbi:MAG TPA: iron-sulfur cluster repair di-iron protein [Gemmatimonadaceae bacterium]|nr:iron-sulfur cluster repair di-iron protein [Gemmatimonadaceae bacterium]